MKDYAIHFHFSLLGTGPSSQSHGEQPASFIISPLRLPKQFQLKRGTLLPPELPSQGLPPPARVLVSLPTACPLRPSRNQSLINDTSYKLQNGAASSHPPPKQPPSPTWTTAPHWSPTRPPCCLHPPLLLSSTGIFKNTNLVTPSPHPSPSVAPSGLGERPPTPVWPARLGPSPACPVDHTRMNAPCSLLT